MPVVTRKHLEKDEKDLSVLERIEKELEPTEEDNALKSIPEQLNWSGRWRRDAKDERKAMKGSLKVEKKADNVGWDKQKEAENMFI
ncbi:hypothetical protein BT69DRAFT_1336769 [Atractiella rhizophila]|nr:hypothetical protein BT69DRAFT_1336769 [Atractiella rhizophila]